MKIFVTVIILFCGACGNAQKIVSSRFEASHIKEILFQAEEVAEIQIVTTDDPEIFLEVRSEGEYFNAIALTTESFQDRLLIKSSFPEALAGGYDKLSAHKVFSLQVSLKIPENLKVSVLSNIASVTASGSYESLQIQTKSGSSILEDFSGDAIINTYTGNIIVETSEATISASTRNGRTDIGEFTPGNNIISLTSVYGDIQVRNTE